MSMQWLIAWDFVGRPKRVFYQVLAEEFGPSEAQRIQRSVFVCKDDFVARRLRALARWYGGDVVSFAISGEGLDDAEADSEAEEFVQRIHPKRLSRRGRRAR